MKAIFNYILSKLLIHEPSKKPEMETENDEFPSENFTPGHLMVIRSRHEMTEGAVALVRISSSDTFNSNDPDRRRQEFVYYADEPEVFFALVTGSLSRSMDVTIHTSKDPESLGFVRQPGGIAQIYRVEQLGGLD